MNFYIYCVRFLSVLHCRHAGTVVDTQEPDSRAMRERQRTRKRKKTNLIETAPGIRLDFFYLFLRFFFRFYFSFII